MTKSIEQQRRKRAAAVQSARRNKGISQEELAKLSGKSVSYIQKIENGARGFGDVIPELLSVIAAQPGKQRRAS